MEEGFNEKIRTNSRRYYFIVNTVIAQTVPNIPSTTPLPQPVHAVTMLDDYAKNVARSAYLWGWPMVNLFNRRAPIIKALGHFVMHCKRSNAAMHRI